MLKYSFSPSSLSPLLLYLGLGLRLRPAHTAFRSRNSKSLSSSGRLARTSCQNHVDRSSAKVSCVIERTDGLPLAPQVPSPWTRRKWRLSVIIHDPASLAISCLHQAQEVGILVCMRPP